MAAEPISIDIRSGKITGARPHELIALRLLGFAVRLMLPFHLFGFSYVCRLVRTLLLSRRKMIFQLDGDSRLLTDYCDASWSVLLMPGFPYETENANLIAASRDVE